MGRIAKAVELSVAGVPLGESTQPDESPVDDPWTPKSAIQPPLDLDALSLLTTQSRLRRSCIAAIINNTVGLGYELRVKEGHEEGISDIETHTRNAVATLNALSRRDKRLRKPSFGRQMRAVAWDRNECGNGYLEVSRNAATGQIDGLFHVPGKRVRRRKDGGWVVLNKQGGSMTDATTYYDFGEKVQYDDEGKPLNKLAEGATRWNVNELIAFQLYTSESRDYGLPPDAALAGDYYGDKLAGETNIAFFDSKGVPPTAIFIQGEEVEEGEIVKIEVPERFIKQIIGTLKGSAHHQHRVAVIGVPSGFKAQVESLAVTSERDLGYINYRSDNRRAFLAAWRLSPVFVADLEDAGRYTAEVERQLTKEQVFDPEQEELAEILDFSLIAELFPPLRVKWDEMRIAGDEVQRQSAIELAALGRITNQELRESHGYPPLPEGGDPEVVPAGWGRQLVEPGLAIHGGGVGARSDQSANGGKPPSVSSIIPPSLPRSPEATFGTINKAVEDDLEHGITSDFDASVDEAIRMIHEQFPDAQLQPVVVEKQGDSIIIAPYSRNGASGG